MRAPPWHTHTKHVKAKIVHAVAKIMHVLAIIAHFVVKYDICGGKNLFFGIFNGENKLFSISAQNMF